MTHFNKTYAPQSFDELLWTDQNTGVRLRQYAEGKRTRHIILHGTYGAGKSTIARMVCEARLGQQMLSGSVLNGSTLKQSDLRILGNTLNLQNIFFASTPLAIIDEANLLSTPDQYRLRALMDSRDCMVIMTTNFLNALDPSLRSRSDTIKIDSVTPQTALPSAQRILKQNGIVRSDADVLTLLQGAGSNWRDILELLEDTILAVDGQHQTVPRHQSSMFKPLSLNGTQ